MPDLGIEVLFKGQNFIRLLTGLGAALRISLIAVLISIPLGMILGALMTWKNPFIKAILRIYLEIVRIMPQMVLLFLVDGICPEKMHPSLYFPFGEQLR